MILKKKLVFAYLSSKKYLLLADKYAFTLIYHEQRTNPRSIIRTAGNAKEGK